MREIFWEYSQLSCFAARLRFVRAIVAFVVAFSGNSAEADGSPAGGPQNNPNQSSVPGKSAEPPIKPDQYDVKLCEEYFNNLKPGLELGAVLEGGAYYNPQRYTINLLCEARTADLSQPAELLAAGAMEVGAPPVDVISLKTLKADFVKAVVESNEFDAPGYDRIAISGANIDGDLNLAKITINNALVFKDIKFHGNLDFSYSSTKHNIDISGTLPELKTLCLKGLQTDESIFISNLSYQPDGQPVQQLTPFCTDTIGTPSIGLQGARIGGQLSIRNTTAKSINAEGAQIAGQVLIQKSKISGAIDFSAAAAGGFFFLEVKSPNDLDETAQCDRSSVYLDVTNVQGSAEFVRSDLCGISMTGAHVSKNVDLLGSRLAFFDFSGSNAEGDLQIGPSLGPPPQLPVWLRAFGTPPANLVLSHSSVALVRVALNNWPRMCDIGIKPEDRKDKCAHPLFFLVEFCANPNQRLPTDWGDKFFGIGKIEQTTVVADFRFKAFGRPFFCASALTTNGYQQSDIMFDDVNTDESKMELWLASAKYSPAEYQLISDLLVTNGQSPDAKKIGYAGKIIETQQDLKDGSYLTYLVMLVSHYTIGYGYYLYYAALWGALFCALGACVFSRAKRGAVHVNEGMIEFEDRSGWGKYVLGPHRFRVIKYVESLRHTGNHRQDYGVINPFGYSFDALLPIIRLRELHYQIELRGGRHYYFYFQRIVGWVLGIFVLGALSGLAK
jgi:hypothetical protein